MGVSCNISIPQPRGFFTPGSDVCGTINYMIDQPTTFKRIVITLKGRGQRIIDEVVGTGDDKNTRTHYDWETYVHADAIVQDQTNAMIHNIGGYSTKFYFRLPENVPPTLNYYNGFIRGYRVKCTIEYYIRIKFETGMLQFDKRFKKEILVRSVLPPRLGPNLNYNVSKTLFQPFRSKESNVSLKATIPYSFLRPGQKVQVYCEIENDSNININSFKWKLFEAYTFYNYNYRMRRDVNVEGLVENTAARTPLIKRGETMNVTVEIDLPENLCSLDYSKMVSRYYFIQLKLSLPTPYSNAGVIVPIQVGYVPQDFYQGMHVIGPFEPPPSYWEAMNEYEKS